MKNNTKKLSYLTLFVAIELVVSIVPFLGFIPLGFINATTLHIPVILCGILLGKKEGAFLGFEFGFISMLKSTFEPNMTSFLFSPFFSLAGVRGNFFSLLIAFIPRILVGYLAGLIYELLEKKYNNIAITISAFIASMTNTILVLSMAFIFFKEPYAKAIGKSLDVVLTYLMTLVATSGLIEAIVASIVVFAVVKASKRFIKF